MRMEVGYEIKMLKMRNGREKKKESSEILQSR